MAERKAREGRGAQATLALVKDTMKDGFGLSAETVDKVIKIIIAQKDLLQMRKYVDGLSGGTYKRLNQSLDMAEKDHAKKQKSGEEDTPEKDDAEKMPKKKDVKESTFLNYLINEMEEEIVSGDVESMDPDEMMKIARLKKTNPKSAMALELKTLMNAQRTAEPVKKADLMKRIKALKIKMKAPAGA